eukprot:GILK01004080.1.p2 GENE.GILK01004080.1~~GILK01004080.1.p2  ORF type:complete len:382 (-),score=49.81 GILK01004080.1:1653-2798(-)
MNTVRFLRASVQSTAVRQLRLLTTTNDSSAIFKMVDDTAEIKEANQLMDKGKFRAAEVPLTRALEVFEHATGPNSVITTDVLKRLVRLYSRLSEHRKAQPLLQRLLEIATSLKEDTTEIQLALSRLHLAQAQSQQALGYAQTALSQAKSRQDGFQSASALLCSGTGRILAEDEASKHLAKQELLACIDILSRGSDIAHVSLLKGGALQNLSVLADSAAAARELLIDSVDNFGKHIPHDEETDLVKARVYCLLGDIDINQQKYTEASSHLKTALTLCEKRLDPESEQLSRPLTLLGRMYHGLAQPVTAEGLFRSSLAKLEDKNLLTVDLVHTLEAYGALLKMWDRRKSEGEKMCQRAAELRLKLPPHAELLHRLYVQKWSLE